MPSIWPRSVNAKTLTPAKTPLFSPLGVVSGSLNINNAKKMFGVCVVIIESAINTSGATNLFALYAAKIPINAIVVSAHHISVIGMNKDVMKIPKAAGLNTGNLRCLMRCFDRTAIMLAMRCERWWCSTPVTAYTINNVITVFLFILNFFVLIQKNKDSKNIIPSITESVNIMS